MTSFDDLANFLRPRTTATETPVAPQAQNDPGLMDRFKAFASSPQGAAFLQAAGRNLGGVPQAGNFLTRANVALGSGFDAMAKQAAAASEQRQREFENRLKVEGAKRAQEQVDIARENVGIRREGVGETRRSNIAQEGLAGQRITNAREQNRINEASVNARISETAQRRQIAGDKFLMGILTDAGKATKAQADAHADTQGFEDSTLFPYDDVYARELEARLHLMGPNRALQALPAMAGLVSKKQFARIQWILQSMQAKGWTHSQAVQALETAIRDRQLAPIAPEAQQSRPSTASPEPVTRTRSVTPVEDEAGDDLESMSIEEMRTLRSKLSSLGEKNRFSRLRAISKEIRKRQKKKSVGGGGGF